MTLPTPSPHVPIENALDGFYSAASHVAEACSVFDTLVERGCLHNQEAIDAVTQAFRAIHAEVRNEASLNESFVSPMREIHSVSRILGQLTHHMTILINQLEGKD